MGLKLGNIACFFHLIFTQNGRLSQIQSFRDIIRVSNSFDPDHDQCVVVSSLGTNCLQWLLAGDSSSQ